MASRRYALAAAGLAGALALLAAPPAPALEPEPGKTVRSARSAAPLYIENGAALTFTVQRSIPPLAGADCGPAVNQTPPGAMIVLSGDGAAFNGMIVAYGEGFDRLIFQDASGRMTCLAGAGGTPSEGTPVGGFQTLLNRPFGVWRFWIAASEPGPFEVRIEYE